ncbi:MAG: hypothetical protein QXL43_02005 [Methanolinea sp.]
MIAAMSVCQFLLVHPEKAGAVRRAVGSLCEVCGSTLTDDAFVIHSFCDPGEEALASPEDLERYLLVLCPRCHEEIHSRQVPVHGQAAIVRGRSEAISLKIRKILGYVPRHYTPPDSDVESAYRDACASRYGNLI